MVLSKVARGLALCALLVAAAAQDISGQQAGSVAAPSQAVSGQQQQTGFAGAPSQALGGQQQGVQQGAMAPSSAMMGGLKAQSEDVDVFNFALQFAYLEAAFYNQAAFGRALPSELLGGGPAPTGGKKGTYTPQVEAFAQELAQTSLAHVRVLRDILGDQAAPIPAINLDTAWQQWANAALNTQLQPAFDPYANDLFFSLAVNQLEGLSVTAFRGLSSLVQNSEYASLFSGILGAEAYYDGAIRWRLSDRLAVVTPWQQPLWRVVNAFSQLRIKLSQQMQGQQGQQQRSGVSQQAGQQQAGVSQQQQAGQMGVRQQAGGQMGQQQQMGQSKFDTGILQPVDQSSLAQAPNPRTFAGGNALQFAAVDPQTGLVFARTPQQVLAVLYGSGDASKPGMFYPQGINGFKA